MCSEVLTDEDLQKIEQNVCVLVDVDGAITALMDAIKQNSTQHEIRRALDKNCHMDETTAVTIATSLKVHLHDEAHRTNRYLPLFNLAEPTWTPLRVEMFKQLIDVVPSVVDAVFTKECNPEGDVIALDYLINSLGKRGVFKEVDYKRLLKSPLSRLWINWDGQCNLLAYAPDEIWKEIEGNQEFTEHATAKFSHTLEFSLTTQQRKCIRRLYQLIVDLKSKQNSKSKDVVASQILWQLLQVKRFDPREETHKFAATVLVKDFGADPLRKFESGECAIMSQELGEDPLPEYKDGQCTITHAIRRGPTFVELSVELFVELFVELCTSRCPLAQKCVEQVVNEDISGDAISESTGTQQEQKKSSEETAMKPTLAQLTTMRITTGEKIKIIESVAPQWKELGDLLDFDPEGRTLALIEATHRVTGPVACCREMFAYWVKGKGRKATWEVLIELLDYIDQLELAKKIKTALHFSSPR